MTAEERKVRERYPGAEIDFRGRGRGFIIWPGLRDRAPMMKQLGSGRSMKLAWADAASRLPALENEQ